MASSESDSAEGAGGFDLESLAANASAERALAGLHAEETAEGHRQPPIDLTAAAFFDVDNTLVQGSSAVHFGEDWPPATTLPTATSLDSSTPRPSSNCSARKTATTSPPAGAKRSRSSRAGQSRSWSGWARRSSTRSSSKKSGPAPGSSPRCTSTRASRSGSSPQRRTNSRPHRTQARPHRSASTVAESADGVFTGRLVGEILHGPGKAHAVRSLAIREGLNLKRCTAYSDSFNDVPMLSLVGTAVAVNPDARLRALARERGWEIRDFRTARKAARIGVPSALALGAAGGALAALASRRQPR